MLDNNGIMRQELMMQLMETWLLGKEKPSKTINWTLDVCLDTQYGNMGILQSPSSRCKSTTNHPFSTAIFLCLPEGNPGPHLGVQPQLYHIYIYIHNIRYIYIYYIMYICIWNIPSYIRVIVIWYI